MKIAIHYSEERFSYCHRWIEYCGTHDIEHKIVNAYDNDIVKQLEDCDIFMWHYNQDYSTDMNFAKQLLFSLQQAGKLTFPDFNTGWHFDDKLGQKYLFEALGIPVALSYAFYSKKTALEWARNTVYPKIFKLRGGAGSANVRMVKDCGECRRYINKAFGRGFKPFNRWAFIKNVYLLHKSGTAHKKDYIRALGALLGFKSKAARLPIQKDYIYFQDFIPNEGFDYRVEVCGDKCIAMIRKCRKGDFRASGAHQDIFDKNGIPKDVIQFAFEVADKMKLQSCALDIVRDKDSGKLFLIENSYCYGVDSDEFEHGYWDRNAVWHDEKFNGLDWMMEYVIGQYSNVGNK